MSEEKQSNGEVVNKYRPWPIAHLDHWFAKREVTKRDYIIVLQSRGFSLKQAHERAAAIREHPELYTVP